MAEYIYFPVSGIQRPDGTWLDGSEVADELNRLAAENAALRRLAFHTGPGEFSPEGWTWQQQAACDLARAIEAEAANAALEEAVMVLGAECRAWRLPYGAETRPGTNRRLAIRDARAATNSNPIAAEACKEKA